MRIRTTSDIGAILRDSRIRLGLEQKALAQKIGVSRQWIVEIEHGKPRAEIGLVLRAINALGIALDARYEGAISARASASPSADRTVDIDSIVAQARKRTR